MTVLLVSTNADLVGEAESRENEVAGVELICSPSYYPGAWDVVVLPVQDFLLLAGHPQTFQTPGGWVPYGPPHLLRTAWVRGAKDYLKDPWLLEELFLRVAQRNEPVEISWVLSGETLRLVPGKIAGVHGEASVTRAEHQLLSALAQRQGLPVSRKLLLHLLHGKGPLPESRVVDSMISQLRGKLRKLAPNGKGNPILTVRGCGYLLP